MKELYVTELTCEYRRNPAGLGVRIPRFAWKLQSEERHVLQKAYRIQVMQPKRQNAVSVIWDSGKVDSDQSVLVDYGGPPLQSGARYEWRVQVWDNHGRQSAWSDQAGWEMGLLNPEDWTADWIAPNPAAIDPQAEEIFLLRKTFEARGNITRAVLYATSHGMYELELNGERVGDRQYTPGWTSYRNRLQVQAYDVTDSVRGGTNAIGAMLANGWYKGKLAWQDKGNIYGDSRALLLQLHIEYEDGAEQQVLSDHSWRASTGPILMSELYHGETYDARLEKTGWTLGDYDDTGWVETQSFNHPKDQLIMQENESAKVTEQLQPVEIIRTPRGETVLDMGQNMVGRLQLRVELPAGTQLILQHAEVLDKEGNFYRGNLRKAKQEVRYVCKGEGEEIYEPHFSFQGFRYVKIDGWPEGVPLQTERFTGQVIHTDMRSAGTFECSHPLLNRLQHNIVWGQRGNFLDVPTDCPQRDERLGWTGDAQVFVRTAAFNYNVALFFAKWLHDLKADQLADGGVPFVIPQVLQEKDASSAAWGDAAVICPWALYECYGDKRLLEEQYDSMKAWIAYMRAQGDNEHLWNTGFHFGDWLGLDAKEGSYVGATPKDLIATCFYAYSTSLFVKAAKVLGRLDDAAEYGMLYHRIIETFMQEFVTPNGRIAAHTQTAHVLPLMFGMVEGQVRKRTADTLARYIEEQNCHLTTGFVGTPYICHVLSDNGYHDLAVKLVQQEDYPSWLYPIHQGATTIWEHWDSIKPDGTFWSDDMNSYNHYAYGSIGDWLYRAVAGLDMEQDKAPGYKSIRFRPRPDSNLAYAKAEYQSPYGLIRSEWRIRTEQDGSDTAVYEFEIPANAAAKAELRAASLPDVTLNGSPALQSEGVLGAEELGGGMVRLELGSGIYRIVVPAAGPNGSELNPRSSGMEY